MSAAVSHPIAARRPASRLRWLSARAALVMGSVAALANPTAAQPPVTALAFSPEGDRLAVGSQAGVTIASWPGLETIELRSVGVPSVHALRFSPDGRRLLIVGGAAGEYGEWEVLAWPGLEALATGLSHDDVIYSAAWLTDNQFVTGAADNDLIQWRLHGAHAEELRRVHAHSRRVLALATLGAPSLVVSAGVDQTLKAWGLADGVLAEPPLRVLDNHTGAVCALAARPGGHAIPWIASASVDRTVRLWQPSIGRLVRIARLPAEPTSLAWRSDGERLAVGCADGKLRVINPETVEIEQTLDGVDGWVFAVAAAADGSFAVGGTAGAVKRVAPAAER